MPQAAPGTVLLGWLLSLKAREKAEVKPDVGRVGAFNCQPLILKIFDYL